MTLADVHPNKYCYMRVYNKEWVWYNPKSNMYILDNEWIKINGIVNS